MAHLEAKDVNLPIRPFLYTLDQVATLLGYNSAKQLQAAGHLFYSGRQPGRPTVRDMVARNISDDGKPPEWRVAERELVRWLKSRGFKVHEPRWLFQ